MLPIVIHLKAKTGFSVRAVAKYITEDRPQQDAPELHATDPTAVADYITREGVSEGGSINLDGLDPTDTRDRDLVIAQMDHIARAGQHKTGFTTNPFYHFVLSWREGENPTKEQAEQAAQHALKALGMADNQAVFAVHRDKEHHHHIHIVANRVNPETLTLNGPPLYDYLILDKACREIELMQGWLHDHGPHVVIDGEIHRLSRQQREELGLLDEPDKRLPAQAIMAESKSGLPRWPAGQRPMLPMNSSTARRGKICILHSRGAICDWKSSRVACRLSASMLMVRRPEPSPPPSTIACHLAVSKSAWAHIATSSQTSNRIPL